MKLLLIGIVTLLWVSCSHAQLPKVMKDCKLIDSTYSACFEP